MLPWLVFTRWTRACVFVLIPLTVAACGSVNRLAAVSEIDTARASVLGIQDARFVPSDTAAMLALGRRVYERELKYFGSLGRPVPPEYILAISGGGDNGAFGAGLLVGWSENRTRPVFKVMTGISTGALIAPFAFLGPEYDPVLAEIYTSIDQGDTFRKRPLLAGVTSDAMADTTPLQNHIAKYVDETTVARIAEEYRRGRMLVVVTTNLDAGIPVMWNIGGIADSAHPERMELIRKVLLASAAVPAVFPPVMFDVTVDGAPHQELHVDGGASMQTFLYPATLRLGKLSGGGSHRARTAYIIRNGRLAETWSETERSTLSIAARAVSTLTTNSGVGDLYRMYAQAKRDGVSFRLAVIDDDFREPRRVRSRLHGEAVRLCARQGPRRLFVADRTARFLNPGSVPRPDE
jgi:Patatin-like phospholipase